MSPGKFQQKKAACPLRQAAFVVGRQRWLSRPLPVAQFLQAIRDATGQQQRGATINRDGSGRRSIGVERRRNTTAGIFFLGQGHAIEGEGQRESGQELGEQK